MDFKHFSHSHGLEFHQMPHGSKGHCSGCKSPVSGKIYACWQCNHFLHEQCFHATRSLKHPCHPLHPLTLVPNPTYQSGSFQCQSCNLIGNGLSYTCAECEFDMHVHCALSPNQNLHGSSLPVPNDTHNYNYNSQHPSYPHRNAHHDRPRQYNAHTHNNTQNCIAQHPNSSHATIHARSGGSSNQQNSFWGPYSQPNTPYPNYNISGSAPYTSRPTNPTLVVNHTTTTATNPPPPLPPPFYPAPTQIRHGGSLTNQNTPVPPTYPHTNTQVSNYTQLDNMSHANSSVQPTPTIPPSMPLPFRPPMNETPKSEALVNPPIQHVATIPNPRNVVNPINTTITNEPPSCNPIHPITTQNSEANTGHSETPSIIRHFSHPHALQKIELGIDSRKICSACECYLSSMAYCCTEPNCAFNLHKACFDSPTELLQTAYHPHPLKLVTSSPYSGGFTCDACCHGGNAFAYTCAICSYDLHIDCVSWPTKMTLPHHEHELTLYYSSASTLKNHDETFFCDTCNNPGDESTWVYYCHECNFGSHLECVASEVKPERVSVSEIEQLQNARLRGLIAKQTQESILELWDDKPKKKKTTYEYIW